MFKAGHTSKSLADAMGISPYVISRIRQDRVRFIDPEVLELLLEVLNVYPNQLLMQQVGVNYDPPESVK